MAADAQAARRTGGAVMAKKIERNFHPSDRYVFDFGACSIERGWAQLDTGQDASYFGTWLNPTKRQTFNYCEGDVTLVTVDTGRGARCGGRGDQTLESVPRPSVSRDRPRL